MLLAEIPCRLLLTCLPTDQVNPLAEDAEGKLIAADTSARLPSCLPLPLNQVNPLAEDVAGCRLLLTCLPTADCC
jgi:hypothetical protein